MLLFTVNQHEYLPKYDRSIDDSLMISMMNSPGRPVESASSKYPRFGYHLRVTLYLNLIETRIAPVLYFTLNNQNEVIL